MASIIASASPTVYIVIVYTVAYSLSPSCLSIIGCGYFRN